MCEIYFQCDIHPSNKDISVETVTMVDVWADMVLEESREARVSAPLGSAKETNDTVYIGSI